MNRGGIGSASIVLVFAVLCLVIFTVITLVPALNEETLIESEVNLVTAFYAADTLAERVFAEILAAPAAPPEVLGIQIETLYFCWDTLAETITFMTPVSDTKGLYIIAVIYPDSYEIHTWRMYNMADWTVCDRINVWQGDFDEFLQGW